MKFKKKHTFLETYNLLTLNWDKIESLNRPITNKETESIKNKETPRPHGFTGKFYQTFKELIPILFKLLQKTGEEGTLLN